MLDARLSGCINHPGVEAVGRCKQCGKPVCGTCLVVGSTGRFCSDECKDRHEKFIGRARDLQDSSRRVGTLGKIRRLLIRAALIVAAIAILCIAAVYYDVPVVASVVRKVMRVLSISIPGL